MNEVKEKVENEAQSDVIENGNTIKRKKQQISITDYFIKRRKMSTTNSGKT